jgi:thiamine pyrophosphokinase
MGEPSRPALVFAGGDPVPAGVADHLPRDALVVAADSGVEQALALGRAVDVAVGDFDSVTPEALERAVAGGALVERHPVEKDATDLELALLAARAAGARHVTVVGGYGGRFDHLLANAVLLAGDDFADLEVDALMGPARVVVVRREVRLTGRPGELVSLLAVGGVARRVRTDGLRYPLRGEDLMPGSTRGISNELVGSLAGVAVAGGVLLAVQPDFERRP